MMEDVWGGACVTDANCVDIISHCDKDQGVTGKVVINPALERSNSIGADMQRNITVGTFLDLNVKVELYCKSSFSLVLDGECRLVWWVWLLAALVVLFMVFSVLSCLCLPCCCLYNCCSSLINCLCCCCPSRRRGYTVARTG